MHLIEKAFVHHKTLEVLNLSQNDLKDYDSIVTILENNRHIQRINVRGSVMTVDSLGYIWLGLRENISVVEIEH